MQYQKSTSYVGDTVNWHKLCEVQHGVQCTTPTIKIECPTCEGTKINPLTKVYKD